MSKKISFYSIIFFVLIGFQGFSQVHFGAKLGGSSSSFIGGGTNITKFISSQNTAFHGGGVVNFEIIKHFSLQTELLYSAKGAPVDFESANPLYNGKVHFSQTLGYFSIPIMAQLNFGSNARSKFHFDLGIVPNWLIHNKFSGSLTTLDVNNQEQTVKFEYPRSMIKQDIGVALGLGLLANGIMFDFRYEIGRKSIYSLTDGIPDMKNRTFYVSIGYIFN